MNVAELMVKFPLTEEQAIKLIEEYKKLEINEPLIYLLKRYVNIMKSFGYEDEELFDFLVSDITFLLISNDHKAFKNELKEKIKNGLHVEILYDKLVQILKDTGLSDMAIEAALEQEEFLLLSPNKLRDNINFYLDNEMLIKKLDLLIRRNSYILLLGEKEYQDILDVLKHFSMDAKDWVQILSNQCLVLTFDLIAYKEAFLWILDHQFTSRTIIIYLCTSPLILRETAYTMEAHTDDLYSLGFSKEEIYKIVNNAPSVLTLPYEKVVEKIAILDTLDSLKFHPMSETEKKRFICESGMLGFKKETIIKKIEKAIYAGIWRYVLNRPSQFMRKPKLIEARAFYIERYHQEDYGEESRLFCPEESFKNRYGCTNKYVLSVYDYFMEKENKSNHMKQLAKAKKK